MNHRNRIHRSIPSSLPCRPLSRTSFCRVCVTRLRVQFGTRTRTRRILEASFDPPLGPTQETYVRKERGFPCSLANEQTNNTFQPVATCSLVAVRRVAPLDRPDGPIFADFSDPSMSGGLLRPRSLDYTAEEGGSGGYLATILNGFEV